ncbi:MAG: endonuclease/exonuclease/phosphatase family protein [Microthrixaceae bacterium]
MARFGLPVALACVLAVLAVACSDSDGSLGELDTLDDTAADSTEVDGAAEDAASPDDDEPAVQIASLNVLHGNPIAAPECAESDQCGAPDRVALLMRHIEESGCPQVVTLQEVDTRMEELIDAALPEVCDGAYTSSLLADQAVSLGIDREMILTTLSIESETLLDLPTVPWSAHHAVIDSPLGPIDLVTTHLASGSNNPLCTETECAPVCEPTDDARLCGARQIVDHLESAGGNALQIVTGDLNERPGEAAHQLFLDAGFADAWAQARMSECEESGDEGCTSGLSSEDLTDPVAQTESRIDYILVKPSPECAVNLSEQDVSGWANEPADPVGQSGIVWVSDHTGLIATIACY